MSDTVYDLKAVVEADASSFINAMNSASSSVDTSLSAIASSATMFIGSDVVRAFTRAINAASEFEQVMADISAITDLNVKQMAKSIADMDNVYGKISKVGNTIYEAISSGIEGSSDDLIEFTKSVGRASKTIRADIEATGSIITTLTNAYGLGIKDVDKLADMLFVTVREGKAQGNDLARTLGLVTNTAAESGIKLEELAAVISILSRTQSASQSMIGLNQMLNGLINPTIEARREAERWGIDISATALQTKGFTAILTELHDKVGGNVEAINKILGNIRAMRAGVTLTGDQFENFIAVLKTAESEIGSGVAFDAFKKQTDTTKQSIENLSVQVDKLLASIGKDLSPITRGLSVFAEDLAKNLESLSTFQKVSLYITAIVGTVGTLVKVIKNVKATTRAIQNISKQLSNSTSNTTHSVKIMRTEFQRVADTIDRIERSMVRVSSLSSKQQIDNAFKRNLSEKEIREQAARNLNMSQSQLDAIDSKDNLKSLRSKESIKAQAERNLGERYKTVKVTAFNDALTKASAVLATFSSTVQGAKTFIHAAFTPDATKVVSKQMWYARRNIAIQARENVAKMYGRNAKGALVDPVSGKFISEQKAIAEERARLERELNNQIKARKDALATEAVQQQKALQQEKQYKTELQREMQRVASARKQEADQLQRDAIRLNAESKRITALRLQQEERLRRDILEQEKNATLVSRSMKALALANEQAAQMRISSTGMQYTSGGVLALTAKDKAEARDLRALRRSYMAKEDQARLMERYNRRFDRHFNNFSVLVLSTSKRFGSSFARLLGGGGILFKLGTSFMALQAAISTAIIGWETGKSIGKALDLENRDWFKTVADGLRFLDPREWGKKSIAKADADTKRQNKQLFSIQKEINTNLTNKLVSDGKLEASVALEIHARTACAKSLDELNTVYKELAEKERKKLSKTEAPKTLEDIAKLKSEYETQTKQLRVDIANFRSTYDKSTKEMNDRGHYVDVAHTFSSGAFRRQIDKQRRIADSTTQEREQVQLNKLIENYNKYTKPLESLQHAISSLTYKGKDVYYGTRDYVHALNMSGEEAIGKALSGKSNTELSRIAEALMLLKSERLRELNDQGLLKSAEATAISKDRNVLTTIGASAIDNPEAARQQLTRIIFEEVRNVANKGLAEPQKKMRAMENRSDEFADKYAKDTSDALHSMLNTSIKEISVKDTKAYKARAFAFTGATEADDARLYSEATPEVVSKMANAYAVYKATLDRLNEFKKLEAEGIGGKELKTAIKKLEGEASIYYDRLKNMETSVTKFFEDSISLRQKNLDKAISKLKSEYTQDSIEYSDELISLLDKESDAIMESKDAALKATKGMSREQIEKLTAKYDSELLDIYSKKVDNITNTIGILSNKDNHALAVEKLKDRSTGIRASRKEESFRDKELSNIYVSAHSKVMALEQELAKLGTTQGSAYQLLKQRLEEAKRQEEIARLTYRKNKYDVALKRQDEARNRDRSLMSTIQGFTGQRSAKGRMTNDALIHSLNLVSRVNGAAMMRSIAKTMYVPNRVSYGVAMANKEQAQKSVSASIDSYIMSQKYAEANLGKTVTNIYDYMTKNNSIMVRR